MKTAPQQWGQPVVWLLGLTILLMFWTLGSQVWWNPGGWEVWMRFVGASLHPDLSASLLKITLANSLITLGYAVAGTFLSVVLGLVGGVLSSQVWWLLILPDLKLRWLVRGLLAVPRGIHEIVWGLFFVNIWGLDPLTAVLAIALPFGAITAKIFSEILDETPRGPLLHLINSGVPPLVAMGYGLFPPAFLNLLSYTFYRFECSLRSAAVLGIIGAGGLGYQIFLSLQSLRFQELWTFFYALFLLNGVVDWLSAWVRKHLGCAARLDLNLKKGGSQPQPEADWLLRSLGIGVSVMIIASFIYIQPDFSKLWATTSGQHLHEILQKSYPPQADPSLAIAALQTLQMSVLAMLLAGLGGIALSFPAAQGFLGAGWGAKVTFLSTRALLLICRCIPAPIWALVFLFVLFPGVLPGALALGVHNLGILGRLMAESNENLDPRPRQALETQGAPPLLAFGYGVLPLALPGSIAYTLYRWEVCMRETVLVGLVGAGGIGRLLTEQLSSFDYAGVSATLSCLILLTFLVDGLSAGLRAALR